MKKNKLIGISSILFSTFIYGFFGVLTRIIGFKIPLFFQSWTRSLFTVLILIIPVIAHSKWQKIRKKDVKWLILRSIGGIMGFVGSFVAFLYIPFGLAYFIFYAGSTISGYILGRLLFKEKLTTVKIISLILALVGISFIYSFSLPTFDKSIYVLYALISGFGTAVWNVFSKKISGNYSALQLNFADTLISCLISFAISFFIKEAWPWKTLSTLILPNLLFIALFFSTGQFMIYGFKHLDVHIASLLMLAEILFGIILGFIFYKEVVSSSAMIGGIIIVTAIILPHLNFVFPNRR